MCVCYNMYLAYKVRSKYKYMYRYLRLILNIDGIYSCYYFVENNDAVDMCKWPVQNNKE